MPNYFIFINYFFHGFKYVVCLQMIQILHHKGDELCLSVTLNVGRVGGGIFTSTQRAPVNYALDVMKSRIAILLFIFYRLY